MERAVREYCARRAAIIEEFCERALQTGVCGVKVVNYPNGEYTVSLSEKVPYGTIHEETMT